MSQVDDNHHTHPVTTPPQSLLDLPSEILTQIITHLLPTDQTFLLNARVPGTTITKSQFGTRISPKIPGTPLLPSAASSSSTPQPPSTIFHTHNIRDITALLLLNKLLHPHILTHLYSANTFYPPDLTTLHLFHASLSPLAVSSIRTLRIDACGPTTLFTRGYNYFYSWAQLCDPQIPETLGLFPGLREVRLGGVGPGVVHRRVFTYRGSRCVREAEVEGVWGVDGIGLVSRIVGGGGGEGDGKDERHTLIGGRVFCTRVDEQSEPPRGSYRLHGTRIVRCGEKGVRLGEMEQEVLDVQAVVVRAREVSEECAASGLTEVYTHDVSFE